MKYVTQICLAIFYFADIKGITQLLLFTLQVEMCLLGHCLGVKLRVARLDHFGQEDFDCCFPDDAPGNWPDCCLLAEDDRHYNVPVA